MNKTMKMLLATTALVGYAGLAMAGNSIYIDESAGGQNQLVIDQSAATSATVGANGAPLTVQGTWHKISITQTGGGQSVVGPSAAPVLAAAGGNYVESDSSTSTGGNTHTVTAINAYGTVDNFAGGGTGASVTMANTTANANTLADNLVTNDTASGAINYTASISGGGNAVTNTITGADSIALNVSVSGNGNTITNNSTGSGAKVVSVSLASSGNTVTNQFNSTTTLPGDTATNGDQTSVLSADGTSKVDFTLVSTGAGNVSNIGLSNVIGGSSAAAGVYVSQSGTSDSIGSATFGTGGITGTAFTITGASGATAGSTLANDGTTTTGANGVVILQASNNALLSGSVTGTGSGYTVLIKQ